MVHTAEIDQMFSELLQCLVAVASGLTEIELKTLLAIAALAERTLEGAAVTPTLELSHRTGLAPIRVEAAIASLNEKELISSDDDKHTLLLENWIKK